MVIKSVLFLGIFNSMILELLNPLVQPFSTLCIDDNTIIYILDWGHFNQVSQERLLLNAGFLVPVRFRRLTRFHESQKRFLVLAESFSVLSRFTDLLSYKSILKDFIRIKFNYLIYKI